MHLGAGLWASVTQSNGKCPPTLVTLPCMPPATSAATLSVAPSGAAVQSPSSAGEAQEFARLQNLGAHNDTFHHEMQFIQILVAIEIGTCTHKDLSPLCNLGLTCLLETSRRRDSKASYNAHARCGQGECHAELRPLVKHHA